MHRTKVNKVTLDIKELIDEVLEILANQIVPNITVRKDYESHLPNIMGDKGQIQRAFMNLIENALQAMPKGGELSISARYEANSEESQSDGTIVVEISDTGVGIPEENLDKIFNLSFSTKRDGYGLGLYIVKQIVERQKGNIIVQSSEGKGTIFTLCFPIEDTES